MHPNLPTITVPGRSGCDVVIERRADRFVVVKSSSNAAYAPRLRRQIARQQEYRRRNSIDNLTVPNIIEQHDREDRYSVTMEYIGLLPFHRFLDRAGTEPLARFADSLWHAIDQEMSWAIEHEFTSDVFINKIEEIRTRTKAKPTEHIASRLDSIRTWFESQGHLVLPTSMCHGDLTLSNVLVSPDGSRIALIDFLDSFVDSPILDMVKLRQDTLFGWSLQLTPDVADPVRADLALRHLDRLLHAQFMSCTSYNRYHTGLQALNLARTLPYLGDASMRQFVTTSISRLGF